MPKKNRLNNGMAEYAIEGTERKQNERGRGNEEEEANEK
jgi:hypothetical protein